MYYNCAGGHATSLRQAPEPLVPEGPPRAET